MTLYFGTTRRLLALALLVSTAGVALGQEAKTADEKKPETASAAGAKPTSFLSDVAPILVRNCIACHNPKKSESKYVMTSFKQLAKGGQQAEGMTLEPGDPDGSYLIELIRPDANPRMPYKQDPLPADQISVIERWVKEGAKYDGQSPDEDWTAVLRRLTPIVIPENYPAALPITSLEFSPDGSEIAASGYHEINLWKTADGTLARRLRGLPERIYDVAYSPDGRLMATAAGDPGQFGSVKLWLADPAGGGKSVRDLLETSDCVFAVSFSPDGKLIAAAGADRALRVWEVESGKLVATIEDHADWILDVAFSPDGTRIATASRDKTCKVFDFAKKESLVTLPNHGDTVYCVLFGPDGKNVFSGGGDNRIRVWTIDNEAKQVREIGGFGGAVFQMRLTPDKKKLVACSMDKSVRVLDAASFAVSKTLEGHGDWVYSVAIAPDGKTIASGSWDGEVRLWNLEDGKALRTFIAAPGRKSASAGK